MVAVHHDLLGRDVGDGVDMSLIFPIAGDAFEAHADFERVGKAFSLLDAKELRLVLAEGVFGLEGHAHLLADALSLERFFYLGEDAAETMQVRHLGIRVVERTPVAVLQLVRESDHRPAVDPRDAPFNWPGHSP